MEKQIPRVSLIKFLRHSIDILKNPLPFHRQNFEKHGDTFCLMIGFRKSVVFSRDAAFARHTLQKNHKNYTKSKIQTEDVAKYVGKGLLTAEGEHWKKQRRLIQPAFHKKQLTSLLETVLEAIQAELLKIKTGTPQDIFPVFNDLAFQTVVKALFSSAVSPSEIKRLQKITEETQQMLVKELRQPYLKWWFHVSGKLKSVLQLTADARGILRELIHERKLSNKKQGDLLDMLLDARYEDGTAMDEDQLIDEILILFTAGHETTSNALTFTCELLARHPEVQEKILSEVKKAASKSENLMEYMKACPYTKQVLEESMRLYPPAYFIDRVNI
jgi:cytochrome P450